MNIKKIIKEEVRKVLSERIGMSFGGGGLFQTVPTTFDNLKWKLNNKQKFFLREMCRVHPEKITEEDIKDASFRLGIPKKNIKSILNTYSDYKSIIEYNGDSEASKASALTFGNKPATAKDVGITSKVSRVPDFTVDSTTKIMHTNQPSMSKLEMKRKYDSDMHNRTWYREGEGKEHQSKTVERLYENLTQSLMLYLYCESNPKDINLRYDDKIQVDFDLVVEEYSFNHLNGSSNYEDNKYRFIKDLLKEFNNKFNCSFVIYEQINIDCGIRMFIENNVTKQVDMSKDSMKMMKNYLLPKIIIGKKIGSENSHIASLLGLDAGDKSWLYGKIGQTPKSEIILNR